MRVKLIAEALDINETQARILSMQIEDIPDKELFKFFAFRQSFVAPMKSKELITKEALFEYRALQFRTAINRGEFKFNDVNEVMDFLKTYYKGKDIGNGLGLFFDYVVIAMNADGELINKFCIDEYQRYKKIDSEDVYLILKDILDNPTKLGDVKQIPFRETPTNTKSIENNTSTSVTISNIVTPIIKRF